LVVCHNTPSQNDEGAAAHIFQILAALQVPLLVLYVARHARPLPRKMLPPLAVLMVIWVCSFAAVLAFTYCLFSQPACRLNQGVVGGRALGTGVG
jgi:hypothetical protein